MGGGVLQNKGDLQGGNSAHGNRHHPDLTSLVDLSRALMSSRLFPKPIYALILASYLCLLLIINFSIRTIIYISVT